MKKITWILWIGLIGTAAVTTFIAFTPSEHERARIWNVYEGKIPGYDVVIDEISHEKDFGLHVYLFPEDKNFYFASSFVSYSGITRHSNDWDYIHYCKQPFLKSEHQPFNSKWTPCPPGKEIIHEIGSEEEILARAKMVEARKVIRDSKFLIHSEPFRAR